MSSARRSAGHSAQWVLGIAGPTGSGKSALALQLAERMPVEIISVDSAQVYRGLDIGTAKPSKAEQQQVRHHLLDLCAPHEVYSAGRFRRDVLRLLAAITSRGRVPLLVGGTMLYWRALFYGIDALPAADPAERALIENQAADQGWPALHEELARLDTAAAARIHPNDAQRIQRALEIKRLSARAMLNQTATVPPPGLLVGPNEHSTADPLARYQFKVAALWPDDRARLNALLQLRLDQMFAEGLIEEVRWLLAQPQVAENCPAARLVGYRQLIHYCRGQETLEQARQRAEIATRQLAKRQLTWLRSGKALPAETTRLDAFSDSERATLLIDWAQSAGSAC